MTTVFSGSGSTGSALQANGLTGATAVQATSDTGYAVSGTSASGNAGVYGKSGMSGVIGETASTSATDSGILGRNTGTGAGVTGTNSGGMGPGVVGVSGVGVSDPKTSSSAGVYGSGSKNGVVGETASGTDSGVLGQNTAAGAGVTGISRSGTGVVGISTSGTGVVGISGTGLAGQFNGNVDVVGTLNKSALTFKIDHPLDPAQKYLLHASVESAEMKNIYDGVAVLDADGAAVVALPAWFEALNTEFRYQLTCIGGYAPVYIAEEVQDNRFKLAGGREGLKVSWQITGIRKDRYAQTHPLLVEQEKPVQERGYYRHPDLYGEPKEKGIGIQSSLYST